MGKGQIKHKETIFKGKLLHLNKLEVLNNGLVSHYECIDHPGAVVVLPVFGDGSIMFVQQYRPAIDGLSIELPAGLKEEGEDILKTAKRELWEETGYKAEKLKLINSFYTSPGYSNERIELVEATCLERKREDCEEGISISIMGEEEVKTWLDKDIIFDGKTLLSLYYYFLHK